jgi:hypothetical protein
MNIEFHYYMTYLIATKGGFSPDDAAIIAWSSQYVDDNDMMFHVDKGKHSSFENYISQTVNILKPKSKLMRIYLAFHFIPGDPLVDSAARKDGMMHWLITTPNSKNANDIMDAAMDTKDLFRIGVGTHAFADTWSHQNFTGSYCDINVCLLEKTLTVGHAQAGHNPDEPALIWKDRRLLHERIDNRSRFLEAAQAILKKYLKYNFHGISENEVNLKCSELAKILDECIGTKDQGNKYKDDRIARYMKKAKSPAFGGIAIKEYDEDKWLDAAVNEHVKFLRDRSLEIMDYDMSRFDPCTDEYTWKDSDQYKDTNWYRFQIAVKDHQKNTLDILIKSNLSHLQLPDGTIELTGGF